MTASIIISCFSIGDSQFSGIEKSIKLLNKTIWFSWIKEFTDDKFDKVHEPIPKIKNVIITGHGSSEFARVGDNNGNFFSPNSLKKLLLKGFSPSKKENNPPPNLYLICCYQGNTSNIEEWSKKTGIEKRNIFAFPEETETALSTLFFLHLLEDINKGLYTETSERKWFNLWKRANTYLYPYFDDIRRIYFENGKDPQVTIKKLGKILFRRELKEFTSLYYRYPQFLEGLGSS